MSQSAGEEERRRRRRKRKRREGEQVSGSEEGAQGQPVESLAAGHAFECREVRAGRACEGARARTGVEGTARGS